jgi:hypothetical protein
MNLMVVSEKHGLIIAGVDSELYVYNFDPITLSIPLKSKPRRISLNNSDVSIY